MISIHMPRKTLALISGLVLVTVVLFFVAWRTSKQPEKMQEQTFPSPVVSQPSPVVPANTALAFDSPMLTVASGQQGKVDVVIDTSDNAVTAVQLELQYDPKSLSNVQVTPGPLFKNPVVLINKNNAQSGRYTYAFGILPNHETVQGKGAVATITFTAKNASGQSSLVLLPETLVTARGVAESVRKDSNVPVTLTVTVGGTGDTMMQNGATSPFPTATAQ